MRVMPPEGARSSWPCVSAHGFFVVKQPNLSGTQAVTQPRKNANESGRNEIENEAGLSKQESRKIACEILCGEAGLSKQEFPGSDSFLRSCFP
jgi:hypothetical protein